MGGRRYIRLRLLLIFYVLIIMTTTVSEDAMINSYLADAMSEYVEKHADSVVNPGCKVICCSKSCKIIECPDVKSDAINKLINKIKFVHMRKAYLCTCMEESLYSGRFHIQEESKEHSEKSCWMPDYIILVKAHFVKKMAEFNAYYLSYIVCIIMQWKLQFEIEISCEILGLMKKRSYSSASNISKRGNKGEEHMLNIFNFNDKFEKQSWLNTYLRTNVPCIASVYPVNFNRLATFSKLFSIKLPDNFSTIKLANAGFSLVGKDLQVVCEGCNMALTITDFTSSPTEDKYHMQGCSFIQAEDKNEQPNANYNMHSQTPDLESSTATAGCFAVSSNPWIDEVSAKPWIDEVSAKPWIDDGVSAKPEHTLATSSNENVVFQGISVSNSLAQSAVGRNNTALFDERFKGDLEVDSPTDCLYGAQGLEQTDKLSTHLQTQSKEQHLLEQEYKRDSNLKIPSELQTDSLERRNNSITEQEEAGQSAVPSQQKTDSPSGELKIPTDQRYIRSRSDSSSSSGYSSEDQASVCPTACADEENGFHAGSSSPSGPSNTQTEFCGAETVRPEYENCQDVQVSREACKKNPGHYAYFPLWKFQSDYIPSNVRHPDVVQFFKLIAGLTVRIVVNMVSKARPKSDFFKETKSISGTGIAVAEPEAHYHFSSTEHLEKRNCFKEFLHFGKRRGYIYIETNRQLVYNDLEAQNATVEFFYDNPNRKGIVFAKGISVHHSPVLGDFKSILLCKTSDASLTNMVRDSRMEIERLAKNFPQNIKEGMVKRIFLVNHPHGGEKVFSYGEYIMIKYQLVMENVNGQSTAKMLRIYNNTKISQIQDGLRKMLLYTADTCSGSTGAVVVSFKKTGSGDTQDIVLDLWMHNGVDTKHGLNASIMKVLTADDIARHGEPVTVRPSIQDDMNAEADRAANQVVSCPVFTVSHPPSHPAYVAFRKRLGSFPNPFNHVHSAEDLANAGFFYSGYGDCVRCFQCGLGLRSWRPGDIINEEHGRNRPDCQFLLLKLREAGITNLSFQRHQRSNGQSSVPNQTDTNTAGFHQNQQRGNQESEPSMAVQPATLSPQRSNRDENSTSVKIQELTYSSSVLPTPQGQEITVAFQCSFQRSAAQDFASSCSAAVAEMNQDAPRNVRVAVQEKEPDALQKEPEIPRNTAVAVQENVPETPRNTAVAVQENVPETPRNTTVAVLEKEQDYLKQILNCKVCCKNPAKDLLLPCGELVACVDCSKLLTHCPSCGVKILATVTTYFS